MSGHPWCRDVSRDEAVRAAEDAAAVPAIMHRDLPEQVALLWASLGDLLGRVVRLEGEMDAGQDEEAAPAVCDPASPVEGLRTERVTLEVRHRSAASIRQWPWKSLIAITHGEVVRVVEETEAMKCMTKLRRERDAALAECERLRTENALLWQAIGLATTAVPHLEIKADDPVGMMQCVVSRVAELEAAAKTAALLAEVRESEWRVASELAAEANAENARGEAEEACAPASPANGLRKERVVLEIEHRKSTAHEWAWRQMIHLDENRGESVRVVDADAVTDESRPTTLRERTPGEAAAYAQGMAATVVADLMRERDAARAEAERQLQWVPLRASKVSGIWSKGAMEVARLKARVAELEAATAASAAGGPEPRGWLTAEERGALERAFDLLCDDDGDQPLAGTVQRLLARSSPPRVKVPPRPVYHDSDYGDGQNKAWKECAAAYTAAIREAGGEVEG